MNLLQNNLYLFVDTIYLFTIYLFLLICRRTENFTIMIDQKKPTQTWLLYF